jgi:predicted phosphodiesterase
MALILHLTDLHLGHRGGSEPLGDYKSDFVPASERVSRYNVLIATLTALGEHLRANGETLDAIVISGDITYAHAVDGFATLDLALSSLGSSLPSPERIVVVPGNHDVKWGTAPSSPERYAEFLTHTRNRGYITPFLDGIDVPVSLGCAAVSHELLIDSEAIQIVALNSANYCGTIEPLAHIKDTEVKAICSRIDVKESEALLKELDALRLFDVARFSPQQFGAVGARLRSFSPTTETPRIRMAVLHHQITSVSTTEEVKPFESIVNAGALREFLLSNEFDVIVHGHKHVGGVFWDVLSNPQSGESRRVLVISGSTVGGIDSARGEVCRLIRIASGTAAPAVTVWRIPAVDSGVRLSLPTPRSFPLWDRTGISQLSVNATKVISATSIDVVYDQLLAYFQERAGRDITRNLVCEIDIAPPAGTLPANYPEIPGRVGTARNEWLQQLVRWWQRPGMALDNPWSFTHGERIYRHNGHDHDQLKMAIEAIHRKLDTSRAVISLVGPESDAWNTDREAPSFCSVQFLVVEREKALRLNCIAYFRKQEMRYWWPVNVAEMVHLQEQVLAELRPRHPNIQAGSIITFSAIAVADNAIPKVAVPIIDRLLDEDANSVWQLAYALVWRSHPERDRIVGKWNELLENLLPPAKANPDGEPIAVRGLQELIKDVDRFRQLHPASPIQDVYNALDSLFQTNKAYALETRASPDQTRRYRWRKDCQRIVARLSKAVEDCWTAD